MTYALPEGFLATKVSIPITIAGVRGHSEAYKAACARMLELGILSEKEYLEHTLMSTSYVFLAAQKFIDANREKLDYFSKQINNSRAITKLLQDVSCVTPGGIPVENGGNYERLFGSRCLVLPDANNQKNLQIMPNVYLGQIEFEINAEATAGALMDGSLQDFFANYLKDLENEKTRTRWITEERVESRVKQSTSVAIKRALMRFSNIVKPAYHEDVITRIATEIEDILKPIEVSIAKEPEDFMDMYSNGPGSCMVYEPGRGAQWEKLRKHKHEPSSWYAYFPHTYGIYIKKSKRVLARAIVLSSGKTQYRGRLYSVDRDAAEHLNMYCAKNNINRDGHTLSADRTEYMFDLPVFDTIIPWPYFDNITGSWWAHNDELKRGITKVTIYSLGWITKNVAETEREKYTCINHTRHPAGCVDLAPFMDQEIFTCPMTGARDKSNNMAMYSLPAEYIAHLNKRLEKPLPAEGPIYCQTMGVAYKDVYQADGMSRRFPYKDEHDLQYFMDRYIPGHIPHRNIKSWINDPKIVCSTEMYAKVKAALRTPEFHKRVEFYFDNWYGVTRNVNVFELNIPLIATLEASSRDVTIRLVPAAKEPIKAIIKAGMWSDDDNEERLTTKEQREYAPLFAQFTFIETRLLKTITNSPVFGLFVGKANIGRGRLHPMNLAVCLASENEDVVASDWRVKDESKLFSALDTMPGETLFKKLCVEDGTLTIPLSDKPEKVSNTPSKDNTTSRVIIR